MEYTEQQLALVLQSLANQKFKWRTIEGVAAETKLSAELVAKIISLNKDKIARSSIPTIDYKDLYTTKEHFLKKASFSEKLIGAFKNRLD